jgi:hypothetical protein
LVQRDHRGTGAEPAPRIKIVGAWPRLIDTTTAALTAYLIEVVE